MTCIRFLTVYVYVGGVSCFIETVVVVVGVVVVEDVVVVVSCIVVVVIQGVPPISGVEGMVVVDINVVVV